MEQAAAATNQTPAQSTWHYQGGQQGKYIHWMQNTEQGQKHVFFHPINTQIVPTPTSETPIATIKKIKSRKILPRPPTPHTIKLPTCNSPQQTNQTVPSTSSRNSDDQTHRQTPSSTQPTHQTQHENLRGILKAQTTQFKQNRSPTIRWILSQTHKEGNREKEEPSTQEEEHSPTTPPPTQPTSQQDSSTLAQNQDNPLISTLLNSKTTEQWETALNETVEHRICVQYRKKMKATQEECTDRWKECGQQNRMCGQVQHGCQRNPSVINQITCQLNEERCRQLILRRDLTARLCNSTRDTLEFRLQICNSTAGCTEMKRQCGIAYLETLVLGHHHTSCHHHQAINDNNE